ncbi:MAG: c-type cytochrome [Crocinitomicaceae bacterium]
MKRKAFKFLTVAAFITTGGLVSCVADHNSPGLEYMPDMYRSPAVEAYVDYGEVDGVYDEEAQKMVEEKFSYLPPVGTVPYQGEGFLAPYNHGGPIGVDKTHGLFEVAQDTAGRDGAKNDVNPIAWSEEVVKEGKVLFERFCMHCHGEKGDGQGSVITNSNGKYPTPGAYKTELTAGEIFYTITYGKNAMGSHASQVSPMERWKIVHYVEKLIGKEQGPATEAATEEVEEGAVEGETEMEAAEGDAQEVEEAHGEGADH